MTDHQIDINGFFGVWKPLSMCEFDMHISNVFIPDTDSKTNQLKAFHASFFCLSELHVPDVPQVQFIRIQCK